MSYDQAPPPPGGGNPYGAPQYGGPPAQDPGRTMGIVGLVLSVFCSLVGAIVSFIAYRRSAAAGWKNNIALAGIIVGLVLFVLSLVLNISMGTFNRLGSI